MNPNDFQGDIQFLYFPFSSLIHKYICIYEIKESHLFAVYFPSQKTKINYLVQHVVSID